ncbi:hypothetical protein DMA11_16840 [Marinilabiliaceae bacterium JC017]|nr:hypothetical protein DMA11_16840 [Marinilabiliaceae bacterium JC017]
MRVTLFLISFFQLGLIVLCQENRDSTRGEATEKYLKSIIQQFEKARDHEGDALDPDDLEIDGMVIDETMTKSGREFYELFFKYWTPPETVKGYSIFISEKPYRLNNTLLEIRIDETIIYQSLMQRRYDLIDEMAKQSIERANAFVLQMATLQKDLSDGDFSGTGI